MSGRSLVPGFQHSAQQFKKRGRHLVGGIIVQINCSGILVFRYRKKGVRWDDGRG